jgi:hypothetical protein
MMAKKATKITSRRKSTKVPAKSIQATINWVPSDSEKIVLLEREVEKLKERLERLEEVNVPFRSY